MEILAYIINKNYTFLFTFPTLLLNSPELGRLKNMFLTIQKDFNFKMHKCGFLIIYLILKRNLENFITFIHLNSIYTIFIQLA